MLNKCRENGKRIVLGDDNNILVSEYRGTRRGGTESVKRGSLKTLDPGTWLNDEVVNYYLRHPLANRYENKWFTDEVRGRHAFYNSFFIQMLFDRKKC